MEEQKETVHKRRVRYKGKYPKKFEEKYKELNPEKYQDTIVHVIQKGNTPAGMHISIMVNEIINFLNIQPGETGFDATLGYGGHTKAMLQQLQGKGHMYATDVDPIESAKTKKRLADAGFGEDILTIKLQNFCTIDEIAKEAGGFDFILADLGVSSMQIDNPERGFSFKVDGPLDLRLNPDKGISAADRLDQIRQPLFPGQIFAPGRNLDARQHDLAVPFFRQALHLCQRIRQRQGAHPPPGIGDDAVGAEIHAAVLDFQHGAGAHAEAAGRQFFKLAARHGIVYRHHPAALRKRPLDQIQKGHAAGAAAQYVDAQGLQLLRRHLGIAAAHAHHRRRIQLFGPADGIA